MIQAAVRRNEIIRFVCGAKSAGSGYVQPQTATEFSQNIFVIICVSSVAICVIYGIQYFIIPQMTTESHRKVTEFFWLTKQSPQPFAQTLHEARNKESEPETRNH